MSNIVIKIEDISKQYRLGLVGSGTLKTDFQNWLARMRGKENLSLQTGSENKLNTIDSNYVWALKGVNLEVQQGEVLGIIGKNGAGKSTLLKLLSRITTPTTGKIKIKGRIASLLEVGTGFHGELTGRENIFLNGAILGMKKSEIKSKLDEIVDFAGIDKYIDTPVKRYSSGMYVRLAFAVAAHLDTEILIADEVLAVGDIEFQKKAIGKMQDISSGQGRTVLFVSHNMGSIRQLCTSGLVMINGMSVYHGKTDDAVNYYLSNTKIENLQFHVHFENDTKKEFCLLEAKIFNQMDELKNDFECDEDIYIGIRGSLNSQIPNLHASILFTKPNGTYVMFSDSYDLGNNLFDGLTSGIHYFVLTIPKRHLGAGKYNITLNFTSDRSIKNSLVDAHECLFSIVLSDTKTIRGDERVGFFSTLLEWEKIDEKTFLQGE